jgi:hypothetical protein
MEDCRLAFLPSLDHLVRSRQHARWNREADLLRRFQVDNELKLGRLLDRQVSGIGTLQDLIYVSCGATVLCATKNLPVIFF